MGYGVGMPSMPGQYMSAGMGGAPMMGYPQGMGGYPAQQPMMPPMASMASFKLPPVNSGGSPTPGAATGKNGGARFKKAPDAPKRFKSAFIIFSAEKHKDIKEHLATQGRTEKVRNGRSNLRLVRGTNSHTQFLKDHRHCQTSVGSMERDACRRERNVGREGSSG